MSSSACNAMQLKRLNTLLKLLAEPHRLRVSRDPGLERRAVSDVAAATGLSLTHVAFRAHPVMILASVVEAAVSRFRKYLQGLAGYKEIMKMATFSKARLK